MGSDGWPDARPHAVIGSSAVLTQAVLHERPGSRLSARAVSDSAEGLGGLLCEPQSWRVDASDCLTESKMTEPDGGIFLQI